MEVREVSGTIFRWGVVSGVVFGDGDISVKCDGVTGGLGADKTYK